MVSLNQENGELPDVPLLLTLKALLQERNITRAANRLGISQPAISARLRRLRAQFLDALFVPARGSRGVVPTPLALALEPLVDDALGALDALRKQERGFDSAKSVRRFIVAMHDNPAMILAPQLIRRIAASAPGCSIAVVRPDREAVASQLERGQVDILVGTPDMVDPNCRARLLLREAFATAQRRAHPRGSGPLDLDTFCSLHHLLVSAEGGGFSGAIDDQLSALGRTRRVAASVQSYALAPVVLQASDMICTLPRRLLAPFAQGLELFDPPLAIPDFALSMIWHPRSQDDEGHQWLRAEIEAVARLRV